MSNMWVFGYGSLIWNPGFEFLDSKVGYIKGYARRFWQGNDFHRGNPEKPGRVATLVEDEQGLTWGRAFLLGAGAESSLTYLDSREAKLGGYITTIVTFYPRDPKEEPFPALLYVALPSSRLYMGPAPLPQVATEIAEAAGHCGHNAEYLLRLADFMREHVPEAWDEHLYLLDHLVRARLKESNLSIEDVMGEGRSLAVAAIAAGNFDNRHEERRRSPSPTSDYASRISSRKLRCLDL
ncbi:glutathione-specific gamma-glutamylcyclotransferase 1-like [Stegodyphus dumicola]|uniref:glutathione-specific gamma-glutamylcyclotransferase 1-like n=1 Tax=Stegodyphus dumicola TaxID=202533 RepID=UPI0015A83FE8|nr:glutathione-specific gamma-glutamylcyclotransferase 1-like [Stegodyphus dumicola]